MVCIVIFSPKMVLVTWMPDSSYRVAGQSKKMAAVRLSFEQRKIIFNWYWKFENVCEVKIYWRREFATQPPIRLTMHSFVTI
jgi:hypothetical protein